MSLFLPVTVTVAGITFSSGSALVRTPLFCCMSVCTCVKATVRPPEACNFLQDTYMALTNS